MKWRSSYYFRLVLSYTLLAVVLIGITGGYLLTNAGEIVTSEVSKDAGYELLNVKELVENNFFRFYEDAFFNKVLMTFNKDSNEEIKYLLEHRAEGNVSRIVRFITDLGLIQDMTPGLDGVTVYMREGEYAMDNNRYYQTPDNSLDAAFIRQLDDIVPNQWFKREKPDSPGHQVMTYVFPLPYQSPPAKAAGFLYLDISLDHLSTMVRDALNYPESHVYMFDENGQMIIGGENAPPDEIAAVQHAMAGSANSQSAAGTFTRHGSSVISVLHRNDAMNRWNYVIVRPNESFQLSASKMKRQVWTACLMALLGGFIISFLMSRHFYMPLKKLLYSIRNLYTGPPPAAAGHEYAAIDHMLMFIDLSMLQMKDQVRTKQITGLITGQQTAAGFGEFPAMPLECRYAVAYMTTEPEGCGILVRIIADQPGLSAELVSLSATEMALLVFMYDDSPTSRAVADTLEAMRTSLGSIPFGAGIGSVVHSVEAIHHSYLEAVEAYKYSYIRGRDAIIRYEEISACRELLLLPQVEYDMLQNRVQAGKVGEVERWIDEMTFTLKSEPLSVEMVELIHLRITTVISQIVIEQKLQDLFPVFGINEKIKRRTLDETMAVLKQQAASIAQHINESRNDAHHEKIVFLKSFIVQHMAEDLSLDEVAGRVSLSANYVSTLFGSISGESFTEYLNRIRLEQAASLLVADRHLTVADIAASVGFRNSQYFCTRFKARFGITPLQYRGSGKLRESVAE
ncbi:helix-turn-helix domain-containing protein [Paenibacillus sepulcri]